MLEIHDELAAQIQNSTEAVEYIDGVSTIAEDDDDEKSTLTSIAEEKMEENEDKEEEEEVQIDTFRVIGIRRSPGECLVSLFTFAWLRSHELSADACLAYFVCQVGAFYRLFTFLS